MERVLTETLVGDTMQKKKHLITECKNLYEIFNDNKRYIQSVQEKRSYYEAMGTDVEKLISGIETRMNKIFGKLERHKKELKDIYGYDYYEECKTLSHAE